MGGGGGAGVMGSFKLPEMRSHKIVFEGERQKRKRKRKGGGGGLMKAPSQNCFSPEKGSKKKKKWAPLKLLSFARSGPYALLKNAKEEKGERKEEKKQDLRGGGKKGERGERAKGTPNSGVSLSPPSRESSIRKQNKKKKRGRTMITITCSQV